MMETTGLPGLSAMSGRIGRYEIHEALGRGAMGVVYRGRDPLLERDVAVKVMATSIVDDVQLRARLEREARAIARLSHPNLVIVHDLGYVDGAPYVVMELLRGRDLSMALARREPLSLERKVQIVLQVLSGLAHAHRSGIVHRDVKPANVFLAEDGRVRVLDFGMARLMEAASRTSSVMGTADYMSPEQLEGRAVDGRSDLFSCGAVLFELLTGWPPFHAENVVTIAYRVVYKEPDFGLLPAGEAHTALRPVLERALAKDPERRYLTAEEFARDLSARAGLAAFTDAEGGAPGAPAVPRAQPTLDYGQAARVEGRGPKAMAIPAAAVVAVALIAYALSPASPLRRPPPRTVAVTNPAPTIAALAPSPSNRPRPHTEGPPRASRPVSPQESPKAGSLPPAASPEPAVSANMPREAAPGASLPPKPEPESAAARAAPPLDPSRLLTGRWEGYVTDEACKGRGAAEDHWDCVQVCMRKGYRPLLAVEGKLYHLVGVERIGGNRNRRVVVEGTLDRATDTITVSPAPAARPRS